MGRKIFNKRCELFLLAIISWRYRNPHAKNDISRAELCDIFACSEHAVRKTLNAMKEKDLIDFDAFDKTFTIRPEGWKVIEYAEAQVG